MLPDVDAKQGQVAVSWNQYLRKKKGKHAQLIRPMRTTRSILNNQLIMSDTNGDSHREALATRG
jgi:hypothetical protein